MPVFASMTLASVSPCRRMASSLGRELLVEVEEAVAIPEVCELIDHDLLEQGTDMEPGTRFSATPPSKASMLLTLP